MTVISEARPAVGFDPATLPADLYIGGTWRAGATGKRIDVVDPSTGARLRLGRGRERRGRAGGGRGGACALAGWAATAPRKRSEMLRRCFELMIERRRCSPS